MCHAFSSHPCFNVPTTNQFKFLCLFVCLFVCLLETQMMRMRMTRKSEADHQTGLDCLFVYTLVCFFLCLFLCLFIHLFVCLLETQMMQMTRKSEADHQTVLELCVLSNFHRLALLCSRSGKIRIGKIFSGATSGARASPLKVSPLERRDAAPTGKLAAMQPRPNMVVIIGDMLCVICCHGQTKATI